jgi:hypothetical protein
MSGRLENLNGQLRLSFLNMNPPSAPSEEAIKAMIPIGLSGTTNMVQVTSIVRVNVPNRNGSPMP